jgi:hypothetical protein
LFQSHLACAMTRRHETVRVLDEPSLPSRLGATRTGGIDLNKPRIGAALAAALTLAAAPRGFTVAQFTAQARQLGKNAGYTIRQGAYDLRKLRGKGLAVKLGTTRRYHVPAQQARTIAALLAIRDQASPRSWQACAVRAKDASPHTGPASTVTTRPCASACRTSSTTSASRPSQQPPHRQHFVDPRTASS